MSSPPPPPPQPTTAVEVPTLPHNLEAERAVLGAVLTANGLWSTVASVLDAEAFFRDAHRRIFRAMARLAAAGAPIDYVCLKDDLRIAGDLEAVGGAAYIASLTDGVPKSTNVEHYAAIVADKRRLRAIIYAAGTAVEQAYQEDATSDILEATVRALLALGAAAGTGARPLREVIQNYIDTWDARTGRGLLTGFPDLDAYFKGGIDPERLVLIAGRPGMGKTTLATNIAEHLAAAGVAVGFFPLEQGADSLAEHALARAARIDVGRLRARTLGPIEWDAIAHGASALMSLPIWVVDGVRTVTQFDAWCRRLKEEHDIGAVVLDYLQMMGDPKTRDRQQEMALMSRSLKHAAVDLRLVVIALSQLSRAPEGRKDKRPQLSDLRESGALEQDADAVCLIFRPDAYDPAHEEAGVAEIIVAKNRLGPLGTAKLVFVKEQSRFASLAR